MRKLKNALSMAINYRDLEQTIHPGSPFFKVLGRPRFQGGPATKFSQLESLLAPPGNAYSAIFCFSAVRVPLFLLKPLKARGAKIIVNQNGVYYPAWCPKGWREKNGYLQKLNRLADHIFFQSRFALESFTHWIEEPPRPYSILHNPVDLKRFYPIEKKPDPKALRILIFTDISSFTRSLWRYAINLVNEFKAHPLEAVAIQWVFMGRVHDAAVFDELPLNKEFEAHFNPSDDEVPQVLRSCDLALHFVYNDVCPNKVLECLASGLWVIGLSAGGTSELLGNGAGLVLPVKEGFGDADYPSFSSVRGAIEEFLKQPGNHRQVAIQQSKHFALDRWRQSLLATVFKEE